MIANISPASISFGESLSTLRYPFTNQFITCRVNDVDTLVGKRHNVKTSFQYPIVHKPFPRSVLKRTQVFCRFPLFTWWSLWFFLTINKYAQRARTIVNRAIINEDPNAKIIRGLLHLFNLSNLILSIRIISWADSKGWGFPLAFICITPGYFLRTKGKCIEQKELVAVQILAYY